jgi:hypothetical protein
MVSDKPEYHSITGPTITSRPGDEYEMIVRKIDQGQTSALLEADPNMAWLIRHDHKDLFYTDNSEQTRVCEGVKSVAKVFATKYAAQMACQGMKHATAVVEAPVYHVVSIRETPNSQPQYYTKNKTFEFGPSGRAARLSADEAKTIAGTVPHKAFQIERFAQ